MNIGILISLGECYGSKWPKIDTFALVVRGSRNLPKMTAFLRRTSGTDRIQPRFHDGSSNLGEVSDFGTMFYAHWHSCFFFTFETWITWPWWAESIEDFVSHLNELPVVLLCPTRSPLDFVKYNIFVFIYCHPGMDMHGVIALNVLAFQIQFPSTLNIFGCFSSMFFPHQDGLWWIIEHPKLNSGCNISHRSLSEDWGDTCGLQIRKGGSEIVGYRRPGRWGSLFKSGVNWAMKTYENIMFDGGFNLLSYFVYIHRHIVLVFKSSCCFASIMT